MSTSIILKADEVLQQALSTYHPNILIASSFSMEDVVLISMAVSHQPKARVFALDTGRLPEATYACAEAVRRRFGLTIEWFFPQSDAVQRLETERGLYSFRESVEARKECCRIRKVEPLSRALAGAKAWVTGMRRDQGVTRQSIQPIETDHAHGGIAKINPLADWDDATLAAYVKEHALPVSRLYDCGYTSIGCAPCTRAIKPGEESRAGRWWWENPEHKECGLHLG